MRWCRFVFVVDITGVSLHFATHALKGGPNADQLALRDESAR